MFGLKRKQLHEAFVGFTLTFALQMVKNKLLDRESNITTVMVYAILWAVHYILRKIIVRHIPE
jgi:hypothetical protein